VTPNPASDKIKVLFSEPIQSIKLYSISGAFIKKELLNGYIDISDLQKGLYFISVNHRYHHKFLNNRRLIIPCFCLFLVSILTFLTSV
jgi:hypothetical protein